MAAVEPGLLLVGAGEGAEARVVAVEGSLGHGAGSYGGPPPRMNANLCDQDEEKQKRRGKIKDPEVVVDTVRLDQQLALDPRRPAFVACFAASDARPLITFVQLGLRAHHQPVVPVNASGSYLAFDLFFGSSQPAGCYRPSSTLRRSLRNRTREGPVSARPAKAWRRHPDSRSGRHRLVSGPLPAWSRSRR